jgi:hypothetical protein
VTRSLGLAWLLLALWTGLLVALRGMALAADSTLGAWMPHLGLVLLLALDGRLAAGRARLAAVVLAGVYAALGPGPPLAFLAGTLGVVGLTRSLRTVLEIDGPLGRAVVAGVAVMALALLVSLARAARLPLEGGEAATLELAWRGALGTALLALVLGARFARLPGLAPLLQGRPSTGLEGAR